MLNSEQSDAYDKMMEDGNIFLTGGAGTGKTYLLKKFISDCQSMGKNVMVVASTGLASMNISGVTIHRAFDAPVGVLNLYKSSYSPSDEIINSDVVVIDEISMCRIDLFDFVCNKIFDANNIRKRSGKKVIKLVVCGDFFQLPPVIRNSERIALNKHYNVDDIGAGYAFQSKMWDILEFKPITLKSTVRQEEKRFIENLNNIRVGNKAYINYIYESSSNKHMDYAITICGTNDEVTKENSLRLSEIDEESISYCANITGNVEQGDVSVDFNLCLKEGARVMTLVNSEYYNNGSLGTVQSCYDSMIVVKMDNGIVQYIERYTWQVFKYSLDDGNKLIKELVGTVEQFPLKLAYAITIHKSQGQTYECANIRPYCWDCGQLYVALSRVKRAENIYFEYKPDIKYVATSLTVIKFYNSINQYVWRNNNVIHESNNKLHADYSDDISKLFDMINML